MQEAKFENIQTLKTFVFFWNYGKYFQRPDNIYYHVLNVAHENGVGHNRFQTSAECNFK